MFINTLKHNYHVIHKLMEDEEFEIFLCREAEENSGIRYRVMRIKSKELTYQLISVFMELKDNTAFEDYYDCFSKEGSFFIVFIDSENPLLTDKLKNERCDLKERLEIGKKLLERILLLNMPDFILYDALSDKNITVSSSLDVAFNYELENIRQFAKVGVHDIKTRLVHIFNTLFENETTLKASIDIKEFLEHLEASEYNSYFEIYHEYEALYEKLNNSDCLQSIKPNTLIFRIWNKAKNLVKFIKPVLIITVLALIICYLIYSIVHRPVDAAAVSNFDQIGTVTIQPDQGR